MLIRRTLIAVFIPMVLLSKCLVVWGDGNERRSFRTSGRATFVKGYIRKDGTTVVGHYRKLSGGNGSALSPSRNGVEPLRFPSVMTTLEIQPPYRTEARTAYRTQTTIIENPISRAVANETPVIEESILQKANSIFAEPSMATVEHPRHLEVLKATTEPRTWTNSHGNSSFKAVFISIDFNFVKLKLVDGTVYSIQISELTESDQQWILRAISIGFERAFRTWKDDSGLNTIEASLIEYDEKKVTFERRNGFRLSMPLKNLSREDQDYLRELPFDPNRSIDDF